MYSKSLVFLTIRLNNACLLAGRLFRAYYSVMTDDKTLMTLKTKPSADTVAEVSVADESRTPQTPEKDLPLLGLFAVGFGVLSVLPFVPGGFIFAPLSLILGLIALFVGHIGLGLTSVVLAMVGIMTSPVLMTLIGAAAFLTWLGGLF